MERGNSHFPSIPSTSPEQHVVSFLDVLPLCHSKNTPNSFVSSSNGLSYESLHGQQLEQGATSVEPQGVDLNVLRSCFVHRNAVDTLAMRIKYFKDIAVSKAVEQLNAFSSEEYGDTNDGVVLNREGDTSNTETLGNLSNDAVHASDVTTQTLSDHRFSFNDLSVCTGMPSGFTMREHFGSRDNVDVCCALHKSSETQETQNPDDATLLGDEDVGCEREQSWTEVLPLDTTTCFQPSTLKKENHYVTTSVVDQRIVTRDVIEGIEVLGPYASWMEPQKKILVCLLKTLQRTGHAVLESPTGTGKTMALLCGLLAWQQHKKRVCATSGDPVPVIYFCTRTHSQIAQVVKELRRTPYCPSTVCLGSARHLCPYECAQEKGIVSSEHMSFRGICRCAVSVVEKRRLKRFHDVCRVIRDQGSAAGMKFMINQRQCIPQSNGGPTTCDGCPLYAALDHPDYAKKCVDLLIPSRTVVVPHKNTRLTSPRRMGLSDTHRSRIWDIEDCKQVCLDRETNRSEESEEEWKNVAGCPYYTAHALAQEADLIMLPYQFVLNPFLLSRNRFPLQHAIVVFDEAHNVEGACCDEGSCSLSRNDILILREVLCQLVLGLTGQAMESHIDKIKALLSWSSLPFPLTGLSLSTLLTALHRVSHASSMPRPIIDLLAYAVSMSLSFQSLLTTADAVVTSYFEATSTEKECPYTVKTWGLTMDSTENKGCESFFTDMALDDVHLQLVTSHISSLYESAIHASRDGVAEAMDISQSHLSVINELLRQFRLQFFFNITAFVETVMLCTRYLRCYVVSLILLSKQKDWELKLSLMVPSPIMDLLCDKVKSIVLTSGTLSPIASVFSQFGSRFTSNICQSLQADHVIGSCQLMALVVRNLLSPKCTPSPTCIDAHCTAANLRDGCFVNHLGCTLVRLIAKIPSGVVVFFSSYSCLDQVLQIWKYNQTVKDRRATPFVSEVSSPSIWDQMTYIKGRIFVEPR